EAGARAGAEPAGGRELLHGTGNDRLSAPTRIDTHHQEEVDLAREGTDGVERRGRIERETRSSTGLANPGDRGRDVAACLDVNRHAGRTGADGFRHVALRMLDHELNVEGQTP